MQPRALEPAAPAPFPSLTPIAAGPASGRAGQGSRSDRGSDTRRVPLTCPIVLFDASIIGASAVTLSTSYAFGLKHSLHRSFRDAGPFYCGSSC